MDTARYILALVTLVGLVPGFLLWFFIHPFAGFWRRLGPVWTYVILSGPVVALMAAVYLAPVERIVDCFGLHLADLDVRQNSAWHNLAVGQCLAAAGVITVALAVLTYQRNFVWADDIAMWRDVIAKASGIADSSS